MKRIRKKGSKEILEILGHRLEVYTDHFAWKHGKQRCIVFKGKERLFCEDGKTRRKAIQRVVIRIRKRIERGGK